MIGLLLRRVLSLVGVLFLLLVAVFLIRMIVPSDPVRAFVGPAASAQAVRAETVALGLNRPLPVQFGLFLDHALHGDLGISIQTRRPVIQDLRQFAPATVELVAGAMVLALVLALVLAILGAKSGALSGAIRVIMLSAASAPVFLIAIILLLVFFLHLGWLPASGQATPGVQSSGPTGFLLVDDLLHGNLAGLRDAIQHLIMPCVCLALAPAVAIGRVLRGSIVDQMELAYIRTARVKGIREWQVLVRHALRNAAGPALSMAGLQMGALLAGDVVIEQIFAWPGIGRYAANAIVYSDFAAITGVVLVFGAVYVIANAVVDLLQLALDPQLRDASRRSGSLRAWSRGRMARIAGAAGGPQRSEDPLQSPERFNAQ